jgi:transcriptional regulator GlxA family with amidase domain
MPFVTQKGMQTPQNSSVLSISLLAVPEVSTSVLYGFHEVFSSVGTIWQRLTGDGNQGQPISTNIVAHTTDVFLTTQGAPVMASYSFQEAPSPDIIVVPELSIMPDDDPRGMWQEAARWLKKQHDAGAIVCSTCTGSIMLAELGLLDGLEATTHWSAFEIFEKHYSNVHLKRERVLLPTGPGHCLVTSGGASSWEDLALYIIARFCDENEARRIAKIFLFGERDRGQLPFASRVRPKQHDDGLIANIQSWISENYARPSPVAKMTDRSGLNQRTFKRRFKAATGYSPIDYVQTLRVEEAKQMLETTSTSVDTIAYEVGYEDVNSFRRLFKRETDLTPMEYRKRFRSVVPKS